MVRLQGGGSQPEPGSVRDISQWLDRGSEDVVSIGKKGYLDEVWNFSHIYKTIDQIFSKVTKEHLEKALLLSNLKIESKEDEEENNEE